MQTFYDIYFGLLYDIPIALLLFRTVESKQTKPIPYYIKLIYCVILFFSSFFSSFLCFVILPLIYCIYVFSGKYQIALKHLIKFEFFYFVIFILFRIAKIELTKKINTIKKPMIPVSVSSCK